MTASVILMNNFGEEFTWYVRGGGFPITGPIAAESIVSNLTSESAEPLANSYADVAAALPAGMVLTGFSAGAGTVADTDTVLEALEKLTGNTQNLAVTDNLLTGLGAGADEAIAATDTILEALAKLQAQIDAL